MRMLKIETSQKIQEETAEEQKNYPLNTLMNNNVKVVLNFVILFLAISVSTVTIAKIIGVTIKEVINSWQYIVSIGSLIILILIGWLKNKLDIEPMGIIAKIVMIFAFTSYLFITVWPNLSSKITPPIKDEINLGSGIYNFRLDPGQLNDKWITIEDNCRYSFSSSTVSDPERQWFFLVYKDGKMIKIDRADAIIPPGPGPFKLMGGENGAYVKLLITKTKKI